jgi:hypothetical protein
MSGYLNVAPNETGIAYHYCIVKCPSGMEQIGTNKCVMLGAKHDVIDYQFNFPADGFTNFGYELTTYDLVLTTNVV